MCCYEQVVCANRLASSLETRSQRSINGIGGLFECKYIDGMQNGFELHRQPRRVFLGGP